MSAQPPATFVNITSLYHEVARCIKREEPYGHLAAAVPRFQKRPDRLIRGIAADIREVRRIPETVDLVIFDGRCELRFGARI